MEIKRCERTRRTFAVLLVDLDGLKLINDRYGHLRGSQALCRVADVLSSVAGASILRPASVGTSLLLSYPKQTRKRPT